KVAEETFGAGILRPSLLRVDGQTVAARLIVRSNKTIYCSVSGFEPAWWDYGPVTLLDTESLKAAIARADVSVNLSKNPETSKLRWSEEVEFHHDFTLVGERLRSQCLFTIRAAAAAVHGVRGERRRAHMRLPAPPTDGHSGFPGFWRRSK